MRKLSDGISSFIRGQTNDEAYIRKMKRVSQVHEIWKSSVEPIILEHTNSVFIINENDKKSLIVYVDESIFAAELNARRELIKLKINKDFNEQIDEFVILISRGNYKKNYPFIEIDEEENKITPVRLSEKEKEDCVEAVSVIENEAVKKALLQAMITSLEYEKGRNL